MAKNFLAEMKRRNVYKVAVAYLLVGWLAIQVAATLFPILEVPHWGAKLVVLLIALGFPIALVIAWAFELTPEESSAMKTPRRRRKAVPILANRLPTVDMPGGDIEKHVDIGFDKLYLGDTAGAREEFLIARKELESQRATHQNDPDFHTVAGLVLAGLGERDKAVEAVGRAVALVPVEKDAEAGGIYLLTLARIHGHFGEADAAIPCSGNSSGCGPPASRPPCCGSIRFGIRYEAIPASRSWSRRRRLGRKRIPRPLARRS